MQKTIFKIEGNKGVAKDCFRMVLSSPVQTCMAPGQFVDIALEGFFLRRPISVCDCSADASGTLLTLLYKTVGDGTRAMASMHPGQTLELLAPLGVQPVHKAVELHVPKPAGGSHFPQHVRNGVRHHNAHVDLLPLREAGEKSLCRCPQRYAFPCARRRHNAAEVHKGDLRQNEIVHFIERVLLQRQVPPPVEIVDCVGHCIAPFMCCFVLAYVGWGRKVNRPFVNFPKVIKLSIPS